MKHRLVIIGFGGMGTWHYENITKRIEDIEVVGAYDIRLEVEENVKAAGLKWYKSLDEVLEDESIDLVTIATPNDVHK